MFTFRRNLFFDVCASAGSLKFIADVISDDAVTSEETDRLLSMMAITRFENEEESIEQLTVQHTTSNKIKY